MKIFIGTDHAGYGFKEKLVLFLRGQGYEVVDKGAYQYNEGDDYPDFVIPVAEEVSKDPNSSMGIVLGATGQGEAMVANKFPHVRAFAYYGESKCVVDDDADIIVRSREHNNSNVISLGARYLTEERVIEAVTLWLKTPFTSEKRHLRRLEKMDQIKIDNEK